jgi:hypothetical protein
VQFQENQNGRKHGNVPNINNNKKFWEELIAHVPLILHGPLRKRRLQQFFVAAGTSLVSNDKGYIERLTDLLRAYVAAGKCLPSRCVATTGVGTDTDTQTDGRDLLSTPLKWVQVP